MIFIKKKICIVGLGYIGLPTAAMFATHGHEILGVDINPAIVEALNAGKITIYEPYLDIMVHAAVTSGNLKGSLTPDKADVYIISVPTPITENKKADMKYVISAAEAIVPHLSKGNLVILESTSPPGTVENLLVPILSKSGLIPGEDLLVAHSPERVLPGRILTELTENPRIAGGINRASAEAVRDLYRTFVKGEIFLTDATTAEMCKLTENTFRDVNIALANELALLCERLKINVWDVIELSNKHPRVNIHQPGPGVGGHCIAVDPWFIVENNESVANLIKLSRKTNDSMPEAVFNRLEKILRERAPSQVKIKVTILGLSYKPNVDDTRESPILKLIDLFISSKTNYEVSLCDPHVSRLPPRYSCLDVLQDPYKASKESDLVILGVNHDQFSKIDYIQLKKVMRTPVIFDSRNFLEKKTAEDNGFEYYLLGDGR